MVKKRRSKPPAPAEDPAALASHIAAILESPLTPPGLYEAMVNYINEAARQLDGFEFKASDIELLISGGDAGEGGDKQ